MFQLHIHLFFLVYFCSLSVYLSFIFSLYLEKKKKVFTYTYMSAHILHTPLRVQNSGGLLNNHHEPLIE